MPSDLGGPRSKSTWAMRMRVESGRHGDDFDATMNTNRIQGDGGKRSIDGGFTVRDAGVGPLEDLYCFVLRLKARMMNKQVNYKTQWSIGTRTKGKLRTVRQTVHDSDSEVGSSPRGRTRHILGISHLNQAIISGLPSVSDLQLSGLRRAAWITAWRY
jgi:hypothetical protein